MNTLKKGLSIDVESNNQSYFIDKICMLEHLQEVYYSYVKEDIEDNITNLFNEIMQAYLTSEAICKTILSIPHIKKDIVKRKNLISDLEEIIKNIKNNADDITLTDDVNEVLEIAQTIHSDHINYNETYKKYINSADEETLKKAIMKIENKMISLKDRAEYIDVCQEYLETPINEYYGFIRSEFNSSFMFGTYLQKDFLGALLSLKAKLFSNIIEFLQSTAKSLIENINKNTYPILSEEFINKLYLIANCSNSIDINITRLINIIRSNELNSETNIYKDINNLINKTNATINYVRDNIKKEEILNEENCSLKRKII